MHMASLQQAAMVMLAGALKVSVAPSTAREGVQGQRAGRAADAQESPAVRSAGGGQVLSLVPCQWSQFTSCV